MENKLFSIRCCSLSFNCSLIIVRCVKRKSECQNASQPQRQSELCQHCAPVQLSSTAWLLHSTANRSHVSVSQPPTHHCTLTHPCGVLKTVETNACKRAANFYEAEPPPAAENKSQQLPPLWKGHLNVEHNPSPDNALRGRVLFQCVQNICCRQRFASHATQQKQNASNSFFLFCHRRQESIPKPQVLWGTLNPKDGTMSSVPLCFLFPYQCLPQCNSWSKPSLE